MKKIDNVLANNVCDNVFFTKSSKYAGKPLGVYGVRSLRQHPVEYRPCKGQGQRPSVTEVAEVNEITVSHAANTAGRLQLPAETATAAGYGRCTCGRSVTLTVTPPSPPVRHRQHHRHPKDPASNILLAVGISLLLSGLITALLGVYGILLKSGGQIYIGSATAAGIILFWTGVTAIVAARRFSNTASVRGFLVTSLLGLLASTGLVVAGHLGSRRFDSALVDVLGGAQLCLGVINCVLLIVGVVASCCCRITRRQSKKQQSKRPCMTSGPVRIHAYP